MKAFNRRICVGLLAATLLQPALAEGINNAPRPAVYSVISIDSDARMVDLRAADGRTVSVYVAEEVYDLSKLSSGDKVKVDFIVSDDKNKKLSAASVWPVE
jgi:hypothetical protein